MDGTAFVLVPADGSILGSGVHRSNSCQFSNLGRVTKPAFVQKYNTEVRQAKRT